ncbi:hypothetical protein SBRCBS47491_009178 [Sporothrix bragantina]|uniref:Carboxylic ester hydrolase n=1 Tax=Sporothrix bragantina TaxID=671064 RepID=A0ABP0CSJ9_9PEZI
MSPTFSLSFQHQHRSRFVASAQSPGKSGLSFCNATVAYHHAGMNDQINLWYWLPSPDAFQNRFLATGGGGYAITSGQRGLGTGLVYGAATGTTDGGFGSWNAQLTDVLLKANGTINYDLLYAFGYKAIHEMTIIGQQLTKQFYAANTTSTNSTAAASGNHLYSYYSGCSEGGREGWSQVQRYGSQFDGVAVGAPAFRQVFLQVMHLFGAAVEAEHDYYPSPCELAKISSDAIAACDELDGKKDGVVSRTDLCRLHFNATSSVGEKYRCGAMGRPLFPPGGPGGPGPSRREEHGVVRRQFGGPPSPASQGIVSAKAAEVANAFWRGLFDSKTGRQIYISYPPSASFADTATAFDASTDSYGPYLTDMGTTFVNMFLREQAVTAANTLFGLSSARSLTGDQLKAWILEGLQKYSDSVQTDWPYLGDYHNNGGKILHYHGESDNSIPVGSSVLYHDSIRRTMYPGQSFNESHAALADWYRLLCLIAWVEHGQNPAQLNATVFGTGDLAGQNETLCSFPLRPLWTNNGTKMDCVYNQTPIDTWLPKLDGLPLPVY